MPPLKPENNKRKRGGVKEKEKSHLGTRFLYASSLSSAEVENLSALVLSFGTVRMGSFHSSVTVMRLSSWPIAACASSPPTARRYQINQPPSARSCHVTSHYYVSPAGDQGPLIAIQGTAARTCGAGTSQARRVPV